MNNTISDARKFLARVLFLTAAIVVFAALFAVQSGSALAAPRCGSKAQGGPCDLPAYGGPGGGDFRAECPPGYYLASIGMTAGSYVDKVMAMCRQWDGTGLKNTQWYGGTGGGNATAACPKGHVWALRVNVAVEDNKLRFVRGVRARCTGVERRVCGGYGGDGCKGVPGDKYDYNECPDGMVGVGLKGKYGQLVDSLGLICGPTPAAAQAPPVQAKTEPAPPPKNYSGNWAVELFPGGKFTFVLTQKGEAITGQMVSTDPTQNGALHGSLQSDKKVTFGFSQPQLNKAGNGRFWFEGTLDKLTGRFTVNGEEAVRLLEGTRK